MKRFLITLLFVPIIFISCSKKKEFKESSWEEIITAINTPDSIGEIINWEHNPHIYEDVENLPPLVLIHGLEMGDNINKTRMDPFAYMEPTKVQFKVAYMFQYLIYLSSAIGEELSLEEISYIIKYSRIMTDSWTAPCLIYGNNLFNLQKNGEFVGYDHWTESLEDFVFNIWEKDQKKIREVVFENE